MVFKKYRKFGIYDILEQDKTFKFLKQSNPSILFMCLSSKRKFFGF
ncbi:hypothetical protein LEP1GSC088_2311 [Leptospira interrogans str. L1207]|nr:hypothetical protein LEP1GSC069_2756 [Leptospira interrogans serovar Canicola str. Fiocruz LV133]EMN49281.1 hypothetical protein LEP1GSC088_2311 [Leptospira interrogans str. L1207]EMN76646.1 hypothetical protein LEP1GSC102_1859 [Leptospira interrogans str. UI 09600]